MDMKLKKITVDQYMVCLCVCVWGGGDRHLSGVFYDLIVVLTISLC